MCIDGWYNCRKLRWSHMLKIVSFQHLRPVGFHGEESSTDPSMFTRELLHYAAHVFIRCGNTADVYFHILMHKCIDICFFKSTRSCSVGPHGRPTPLIPRTGWRRASWEVGKMPGQGLWFHWSTHWSSLVAIGWLKSSYQWRLNDAMLWLSDGGGSWW